MRGGQNEPRQPCQVRGCGYQPAGYRAGIYGDSDRIKREDEMKFKLPKPTVRFQVRKNDEQKATGTVFNTSWEAKEYGDRLVECGWLQSFQVIPVKAIWLRG
jgi:hypothetical protein